MYLFTLLSLLFRKKKRNCENLECNVTVLIPVYNAEKTIQNTINSIVCQKYDGQIHVIVIDDGSTDGSLALLKQMNENCKMTILEACHKGKADALNEGLKHVTTEYVLTVDSDTYLHPLVIRNIMK